MKTKDLPTLKDLEFGKIASFIAMEHHRQLNAGEFVGECLSTKIGKALKDFRVKNRKSKKQKQVSVAEQMVSDMGYMQDRLREEMEISDSLRGQW